MVIYDKDIGLTITGIIDKVSWGHINFQGRGTSILEVMGWHMVMWEAQLWYIDIDWYEVYVLKNILVGQISYFSVVLVTEN